MNHKYVNKYLDGVRYRAHAKEYLDSLPENKLLDFLPSINPNLPSEMQALGAWVKYFREEKIPFVVKRHQTFFHGKPGPKRLVLWKELRI